MEGECGNGTVSAFVAFVVGVLGGADTTTGRRKDCRRRSELREEEEVRVVSPGQLHVGV